MSKPIEIIEGHIRKFLVDTPFSSTQLEELSAKRLAICKACKKSDGTPCLSETNRCCYCTCDMEAKSLVKNSICPKGKW